MHIYIYMYIDIFMYTNMYVYCKRNTHLIKYFKKTKKEKHSRPDWAQHIYVYMNVRIYILLFLYIHIYIYTYIHIYIHIKFRPNLSAYHTPTSSGTAKNKHANESNPAYAINAARWNPARVSVWKTKVPGKWRVRHASALAAFCVAHRPEAQYKGIINSAKGGSAPRHHARMQRRLPKATLPSEIV